MRRTIVFVTIAVVALVAVPFAVIGQPFGTAGGTPSGVFLNTGATCAPSIQWELSL
jgi:hypothetical protein